MAETRWTTRSGGEGFPAWLAILLFLLGTLFVASALFMEMPMLAFGTLATGVVENVTYSRRVAQLTVRVDRQGAPPARFKMSENLNWGHAEGDSVRVAYDSADLSSGAILDFPQMWFPLTAKFFLGTLALWGGLALWKRRRR